MTSDASQTFIVPELLAPAGGPEAFRAAIANGADAVYLGLEVLNARRSAENFTLASLGEACRTAHLLGVRVYLTANVVVLPTEVHEALDLVDSAWAAGIDAVIVQDLGLLHAVREKLPHVRVHTSTQVNAHNSATIQTLAGLGVSRVTLAREVSLEEIAGFVALDSVQIEAFVHGALCVCYSGQCLMSSLIGGRSANRGQCAQPCRLPYELLDDAGTALAAPGAHLLSPKDLAGIAVLGGLVEAGVSALKIEGRMKSAEYVALVTGVYRAAIDRAAADPEAFAVRDGEQAVLAEAFSRGFSEAYLVHERGNDMMSYARPNNRGVPVGRVSSVATGQATVSLDASLEAEDTIEFWTSAGRFAQPAGELSYGGATHRRAPRGVSVVIAVQESVGTGDRVFRVRNAALTTAARRSFATDGRLIDLAVAVNATEGQALEITVADAQGRSGRAAGAMVEAARTKALTAEEIIEHVGRFGGTHYTAVSWDVQLSTGVGLGFSALHRTRREAIEAYEASVLAPWENRARAHPTMRDASGRPGHRKLRIPDLIVSTDDRGVARAALEAGADAAHVPTHTLRAGEGEPGWVPVLPRILHDTEFDTSLAFAQNGAPVVAGNLGALSAAASRGALVEAHWSLNAVNAFSVAQLAGLGAKRVWLSSELSGRQIAEIAADSSCEVGTAIYGRQEVMTTEHCVLMAEGPCDRECRACARRGRSHSLRDRKGYEFPVRTDITGRSHLYNSVPLDLTAALPELLEARIGALRIDLDTETPQQAAAIVRSVRKALDAALAGAPLPPVARDGKTTSGHFFRGLT